MTLVADNVRVGITGAVYVGPKGSTLPTDSTTSWDAALQDLGWIGENGLEEAYNDSTKDIRAWQNGTLVRRLITQSEATVKFTCIETTGRSLKLYHKGSLITVAAGKSTLQVKDPQPDHRAFGFDVLDGTKHVRLVVPDGEVTDRGNIIYKNDEAIGYELTVTCYPDSSGVVLIKYSDDTAWTLS